LWLKAHLVSTIHARVPTGVEPAHLPGSHGDTGVAHRRGGSRSRDQTSAMIAKRAFDLLMAAVALVILSPLLLLVAAWIKHDSSGPVIFRQQRVGRWGRPFEILKFRSMHMGNDGPEITVSGDARITPSGLVLRRFKLD